MTKLREIQYLAPGRLEVPVSIGTPINAASSPSAVSWYGNLPIVAIPDTLATNSALGGTLYRFPEYFLMGLLPVDRLSKSLHAANVGLDAWTFTAFRKCARKTPLILLRLLFKFFQNDSILKSILLYRPTGAFGLCPRSRQS